MKTIEQIALNLTLAFGETTEEITMLSKATCYELGVKAGVEFAQKWIPIEEELPEYYKPVLGLFLVHGIEAPLSVWRAFSDTSDRDIYTIMGTSILADGVPFKWRPITIQ